MNEMMTDLSASSTDDADQDFDLMMVPHHQGAIAMAKVLLQYGKDSALHKMF